MRAPLLLALLLALAATAHAQPATAGRVPAAETAFENGLRAYVDGSYEEAYRLFERAADSYGYNARTTAALVMAGKAAYADGDFALATRTLDGFVQRYPGSRYVSEAERVAALARSGGPDVIPATPYTLGIVLPASGDAGYLAQALFNGVRLAVDEYNAGRPRRPVRMVFRDTEGTDQGTRGAIRGVADAGAALVIGPLFSEEALVAAEMAETVGVPLVAPLATDRRVSVGRRYAFQANPTFEMRGRVIAAYAAGRLRATTSATVAEEGSYGEQMADAFEDEWRRAGGTVAFSERLTESASWRRLPDVVGPDAWFDVDVVYLPVSGEDAPEHAADALRALEALGLDGQVRPLGNTEWEGLDASRARAARFGTVFTQDFLVDDAATAGFVSRYRTLSGIGADRLALMGYDLGRFLIPLLDTPGEGALADRIRRAPRYGGLAHRFDFAGGQVNRALFIMGYRNGEVALVE